MNYELEPDEFDTKEEFGETTITRDQSGSTNVDSSIDSVNIIKTPEPQTQQKFSGAELLGLVLLIIFISICLIFTGFYFVAVRNNPDFKSRNQSQNQLINKD